MRIVVRFFHKIYCIYVIVLFVVLMLVIFPGVLFSTLFGTIRGGNMIYWLCKRWADTWFFLIGIYHQCIPGKEKDLSRSFIYVCNHISYIDAALIVEAFRHPVRPLAKVELSRVPLFGLIYRYVAVTVDRSSPENRANSLVALKALLQKGISVLVFPEGTFNISNKPLKEFYDGAFRLAIETGTPIKPVLFLDAYRRMSYEALLSFTPGRSRILYLPEISVDGYTADNLTELKEKVFAIMEEKMIEYDGGWRKEPN